MWFKSSSYVNNLFRLCASLWNKLLKLLLSICFTCFQAIISIQLRTLHFCKRTTECLSLVKSQHVYIYCISVVWLASTVCTHACFDESSRRGGVVTRIRGGVHRRLLIVKVWIPVGCLWWLMGVPPEFISVPLLLLFSVSPAWLFKL